MNKKEYTMPVGGTIIFWYDDNNVGQITLEAMDLLMSMITEKWIPCSERLPEPGEYYLVTRQYSGEYREIDIAKYDFDGWHKADTVLAWCEMPEPYKGDKE